MESTYKEEQKNESHIENHSDDIALTEDDNGSSHDNQPKQMKGKHTYVRSLNGVLMVINTVLLLLCWVIVAGWRLKVADKVESAIESQTFFLIVTILAFIINTLILVVFMARLHEKYLSMINWPILFLVLLPIEALLVVLVTAIMLGEVQTEDMHCEVMKCSGLRAAGSFGVFAVVGLIIATGVIVKDKYFKR